MNTIQLPNPIDINAPIETILQNKAQYHTDQIEFHKSQLAAIKEFFGQRNGIKVAPKRPIDTTPENNGNNQSISQTIVKPLIIAYLKGNSGKHVTTDIYDAIKNDSQLFGQDRKPIVNSISLCLNSLTKGKIPKVKKTNTKKGNIKAYEWIENIEDL